MLNRPIIFSRFGLGLHDTLDSADTGGEFDDKAFRVAIGLGDPVVQIVLELLRLALEDARFQGVLSNLLLQARDDRRKVRHRRLVPRTLLVWSVQLANVVVVRRDRRRT